MAGQDESRYVPVAEAATLLGIKPDSIRKRLQRGSLPGHLYNGQWRVDLDAIQDAGSRPSIRPTSLTTSRLDGQDTVLLAAILATLERLTDLVEQQNALLERQQPRDQDAVQPDQDPALDTAVTIPPRRPGWRRLLGWS